MNTRYTVQLVRGSGMGSGMYQVVDVYQGRNVGEPVFWKEEAEKTASRLNDEENLATREDARVSKSESCGDQTLHETSHETKITLLNDNSGPSEEASPENPVELAAAAQSLGLRQVRAWVPDKSPKSQSASAQRSKRSRENSEQQGVKQLSVTLPTDLHDRVKSLAARIRAGEPAALVWADLSPAQNQTPTPVIPLSAQGKRLGWRRWLLRWLLPTGLKRLIK